MKCAICGKEFDKSHWGGEFSEVCSEDCFSEMFWRLKESAHKENPFIIVNGTCYNNAGYKDPKTYRGFLGFGGRVFNIELEDGTKIMTNNLWCAGEVPDNHREILKDNARFVKE